MKTKIIILLFMLFCGTYSFAQMGIGTTTPNPSTQLEIVANDRGILIPNVALTSETDQTTIANGNVESLLVYNTSTNGNLSTGYHYWANNKWNRLSTGELSAIIDNLTSVSTTEPLSANQGRVLKELIDINTAKAGLTPAQATVLGNTSGTNTGDQDISGIATNATTISTLQTEQTAQNNAIALNTAKVGLTTAQTTILGNTSGTNTGDQDISGIATNASAISTLQTEQTTQNDAIALNTAKVGLTTAQATILGNTSGTNTGDQDISGIATNASALSTLQTEQTAQNNAIALNTAKVGLTTAQATILGNTSGTNTGDQDISGIATNASAISTLQTEQTTQNDAIALNTAKVGLTTAQATILGNTSGTNTGDQDISGIATNASAISTLQTEQTAQNTAIATKLDATAAFTGDVTGTYNATKVAAIDGTAVDMTTATPTDGQIIKWDGASSKWVPADDSDTNITVVNDLNTGGTTDALSAEQGKTLENSKAAKANVLELDNTNAFTPDADYEPATKKYVDDSNTTIINDLTTGGTTDALSAEQGKALQDTKLNSTLADGTVFIGNGSNIATSQTLSGDATLATNGALTIADNAVDGTDISLAGETAGDIAYYDGTDWVRLPKGSANQSLVMNSGATAPEWQSGGPTEDVEVVLASATGGYGTTIAIPANVSDYEYIRLETDNWDIASDLHAVHGTILVSNMAGKRILIYADTVYYLHADINASGTSLTVHCTGSATWRIVGIKVQKVVLDPLLTTVIDDDTFATASSSNVPSAESVKAYVDGKFPKGSLSMMMVARMSGDGDVTVTGTNPFPFNQVDTSVDIEGNSAVTLTNNGFRVKPGYAVELEGDMRIGTNHTAYATFIWRKDGVSIQSTHGAAENHGASNDPSLSGGHSAVAVSSTGNVSSDFVLHRLAGIATSFLKDAPGDHIGTSRISIKVYKL